MGTAVKNCIICGQPTDHPILEALSHFRLVEWNQWCFWKGNIVTFGFWSGMRGNITLSFPFINTLVHWKHRKSRLVFPNDQ